MTSGRPDRVTKAEIKRTGQIKERKIKQWFSTRDYLDPQRMADKIWRGF